jgi:diaminohydroxyphosphoribosylaminopyrimidine deaminase / 5-amino-6-(5-phosphoribosylamino)uracil reductase
VIVATTSGHDRDKARALRERGVRVIELADSRGRVDLRELMQELGRMEVARLLVEGGPTLVASLCEEGLADRLALFLAPKVFGDAEARSWMEGREASDPAQGLPLAWRRARKVGVDLLLEADMGRGT